MCLTGRDRISDHAAGTGAGELLSVRLAGTGASGGTAGDWGRCFPEVQKSGVCLCAGYRAEDRKMGISRLRKSKSAGNQP